MSIKSKESRSQVLPVLNPQPPLLPDQHPVVVAPNQPEPIDIQELITKIRLKLSPPRSSNNTPLKQSTARMEVDSLKQRIQQLEADKQRLAEELNKQGSAPPPTPTSTDQQYNQLQSDYRALKQNYDELAKRYHEGEQAFFHLKSRCEYLEAELKKALDQPLPQALPAPALMTFNPTRLQQQLSELRNENAILLSHLTAKEVELKSALSQLRISNDQLSKLRATESPKNNFSFQLSQNRKTTQLMGYYDRNRLTSELAKISEESAEHRLKTQNQRLMEEMQQFRQEYNRLSDDNLRLKNELVLLKSDLIKRQSYKIECQSITRQLHSEKQGQQLYATECLRLKNEVATLTELRQQDKKEFEALLQLERKEIGQTFRHEHERDSNKSAQKQEVERYRNMTQKLHNDKEEMEEVIRDLNLELALERGKSLRLETELSKTQEELQKLRHPTHRSRNQSTEKKYTMNRFSEDSKDLDDAGQLVKLREELQYLHANRVHQDGQIKKLQEQLRRTKLEVSVDHSEDSLLKKQLDLSVRQMKHLSELAKQNNGELMQKIVMLYTEKQQLEKKSQCQQFQLTKLYEVLQTRREELENCYKTIEGLRKGISAPLQTAELDELLRTRRQRPF